MSDAGDHEKEGRDVAVTAPSAGAPSANGSGGVASGPTPAVAAASAPARFSRRPLEVAPASAGSGSPPPAIAARTCQGASPGSRPRIAAAAPATWGAAIDVPLR